MLNRNWLMSLMLSIPIGLFSQGTSPAQFAPKNIQLHAKGKKKVPIIKVSHKRGKRGKQGKRGHRGHRGHTGNTGAQGPIGPSAIGPSFPGVDAFLTFTTKQDPSPSASGRWQLIVVRPDFSQVILGTFNIKDPSNTYTLTVPGPAFLGIYCVVLYNIDINNPSISDVVDGPIMGTNNASNVETNLFTANSDITDTPGQTLEAFFQGFTPSP